MAVPGRTVSVNEATTTTCLCFGHRQRTLAVMAADLVIPDLVIPDLVIVTPDLVTPDLVIGY